MKPAKIFLISSILGFTTLSLGFFYLQNLPKPPAPEAAKTVLTLEKLEKADSNEEHQLGLMGRTDLCADCGMLFVFSDQSPRTFWMKNTPTSLDMIFIRSDGKIAEIHEKTIPNSENTYPSGPVQYVLEVPAGYVQRHGLRVNQQIDIQHLLSQSK